ncbi:MAG: hypothetical protein OHK0015_23810 [Chloroflexi bacterium OHK40]
MAALGSLIALGAALVFAIVGLLTLWGGLITLTGELPRGFRRTAAGPGNRAATVALVALPLIATAAFSLLAAWRILLVALGMG